MCDLIRELVPEHLDDRVVLGEAKPLQQGGHRQLLRPFGQIALASSLLEYVGGMVGTLLDEGRVVRLVGMVLFEIG